MKRSGPDHPKVRRLARRLDVGRAQAIGHLELLWHFAARYAPRGDVGRWTDADIEEACAWEGDPGALVAALRDERWLDPHPEHRLLVHDWPEHADQAVKKALQRAGLEFVSTSAKLDMSDQDEIPVPDMSGHRPDMDSLPEPEPEPVASSQSQKPGEEERAPRAAPARRSNGRDPPDVAAAWDRLCDALAQYPGAPRPGKLTSARRSALMARMREHPELGTDVGAALVHGYAARHPRPDGDFDPDAHRRPDTILRPNKAEERIEAYRDAIAAGRSPPFLPSAVVPVRQSAARARAEGTIQAVREVSALRRGREP